MAGRISYNIKKEKEEISKKIKNKFSKENLKKTGNGFLDALKKISYTIGGVFAIGATIGLIGGLGAALPLALTSAAFFVVPSVPKIWRKLTGKVNKTKKNATSIEVKENTNLNDACKEFEKAVSEVREKFSKDNHTTKTDYERMKKYYDILISKNAFALGLIDEDDKKFFEMYEETYNEQLKDFIRGTKKTNEKETEFNKKISTLKSKYEILKEKLNSKSYVFEDVVDLGKNLAKYYDEVDSYASSNEMKDKFDEFVKKNGIKSFILTDVVKIIKDSENYQKLDDEMNALKVMKEDLSAKIQSGNESKETLNNLLKKLCDKYNETLNFSISIGEKSYFNNFIKNNGIDTFIKEAANKINKDSKKTDDKEDKKDTDNKSLSDRLDALEKEYEKLKLAITSRKLSKVEIIKMSKNYNNFYYEIYKFADSINQSDIFENFVSTKNINEFFSIDFEKLILDYVPLEEVEEKNDIVDKKLEILLIEYKKVLLLLRKDKKFNEKNIAELSNFTQLYNEVRDYCKSTKQENKFDRFIKENKFDVFAQLVGSYAYVQKTLTEKNKGVDIFVDAIHEDGMDVMADVYIKNGDTYTKESVSLKYRPKKDTNTSTIIKNIEDRIADRYFVSKNKVKVIKFNGKDYENIEDLNLEESSIRR